MPHQCTGCGYTFADGSKEMLGGCPDCGGNKFQFHPNGTDLPDEPPDDATPPEPETDPGNAASTVGRAATKVRDFVSGSEPTPNTDTTADPDSTPDPDSASTPDGSPETGQSLDRPSASETDTTADPAADASQSDEASSGASHDEESRSGHGSGESTPSISVGEVPDPDAPWPEPDDADDGSSDADETLPTDDDGIIDADAYATEEALRDAENPAQAQARTDVVSEADIPDTPPDNDRGDSNDTNTSSVSAAADSSSASESPTPPDADGRVVSEPSDEETDIDELREQLNDQFESIKIVEPGQYELNLMELYDRDEYIIALQENGRYVIQMPEQWISDRNVE